MSERKTSDAQRKAIEKYEKNMDRVNCRFPSGTKDRIMKTGYKSINSFIISAVMEKLEKEEKYFK